MPAVTEEGEFGYMVRDTGGSGIEFATAEQLEEAGFYDEQIVISKPE